MGMVRKTTPSMWCIGGIWKDSFPGSIKVRALWPIGVNPLGVQYGQDFALRDCQE